MKINDYGKASILASLISWTIGIVFTLLSLWSIAVTYEGYNGGDPLPENILMAAMPAVSFLAFPCSILAIVFGVAALLKKQSRTWAVISLFLSIPPLLVFGIIFLLASYGPV